jgi:hypothetical protein
MGLSYGLMGWYCSRFSGILHSWAWPSTIALTFAIIWGWPIIFRAILRTPWIVPFSLLLTLTLAITVTFWDLFVLVIVLFTSTMFAKLELQTGGFSRLWAMVIISVVSGTLIGGGWTVGHHFYFPD